GAGGRLEDLPEYRHVVDLRRVERERRDVSVEMASVLVAQRLGRIVRHARRRQHGRLVRAQPQVRDKGVLVRDDRAVRADEIAHARLAVEAVAAVAAVLVVELLADRGIGPALVLTEGERGGGAREEERAVRKDGT